MSAEKKKLNTRPRKKSSSQNQSAEIVSRPSTTTKSPIATEMTASLWSAGLKPPMIYAPFKVSITMTFEIIMILTM